MRRYSGAVLRALTRSERLVLPFLNRTLTHPCAPFSPKPLFSLAATAAALESPPQHFNLLGRTFCYSSPPGPSNIVVIDSEETFNESLRKVQDEALPAIFYFTAVWCGPCRALSPVMGQLSENYPHVTTYKIDIDQESLGKKLSELSIHAVPTLHFFKDGKKASEVIGADLISLKQTVKELYE